MYDIYLCIHPVNHFPTWIDFRYRKTQFSSILMLRNHGLPRFDFSHFKKKYLEASAPGNLKPSWKSLKTLGEHSRGGGSAYIGG